MQLLNRTGQLSCYGEVFLHRSRETFAGDPRLAPPLFYQEFEERNDVHGGPGRYLQYLEQASARPVAFKVMYDQIRRKPSILLAATRRRYSFVHLTRRNLLRGVTSQLLAEKTAIFHSRSPVSHPQIEIEPDLLLARLRHVDLLNHIAGASVRAFRRPILRIEYEELLIDHLSAVQDVCRLAGLPVPVSLSDGGDDWTKTNDRPLSACYANFAQISRKLGRSKYAWMLES